MVKKNNDSNICQWPLCKKPATMTYQHGEKTYGMCGAHWDEFSKIESKEEAMAQLIVKRKKKSKDEEATPKSTSKKKVSKKTTKKKVAKKKTKRTPGPRKPLSAEQKRIRRIKRKQGVKLVWFGQELLSNLEAIAKSEKCSIGDLVRDAVRMKVLPLLKDKRH